MTGTRPLPCCGTPFATTLVIAVLTMLKQFHLSVTHKFIAYLAQYVRCLVRRVSIPSVCVWMTPDM